MYIALSSRNSWGAGAWALFAVVALPIEGRILERGTRKPLEGVNVFVLPHKLRATTDASGSFRLPEVPAGEFEWVVNAAGYERLQEADKAEASRGSRTLYLERQSYQALETTIYGKQDTRDGSRKALSYQEFSTLPGSGGDPLKAVQNLPGVNRPSGFSSRVVIQGSNPQDTNYMIEGHEVPLIFHFGGLTSVMIPESLDSVEYLSAGYGAEYGRAMGGLIGVRTRASRSERWHGQAFMDLINAGAFIEGPVGKESSLFVGARQSYIGEVLALVAEDNDDFDLTVAPTYSDLTLVYDTRITSRDRFRFTGVGSSDSLEFVLKTPVNADPSIRGDFVTRTRFFRLIPQFEHRHSRRTVSRWSLGLGKDWIRFSTEENNFSLQTTVMTARGEVERKMSKAWTSTWGFDNRYARAQVQLDLPVVYSAGGVSNPLGSGETQTREVDAKSNQIGAYWRNQLQWGEGPGWRLVPAARVDHFTTTQEWLASPRLEVRRLFNPHESVRLAGGLYFQAPEEQQTDEETGNPDLSSPRSWHLTGGWERDFRAGASDGWTLSLAGFYRYFDELVEQSVTERFANDGRGRAFGGEVWLRYRQDRFSGWLAYTLSRSRRWSEERAESFAQSDQTHNVNLVGALDLPGNWRFSARVRYVTGNPLTPVVDSIYDSDNDVHIPVRGPYFSERVDPFFQVDLRIDKKWIFDTWILSAYLDVQNVTNQGNVESVSYSYDYRERTAVEGLPMVPTLGIKGEF
ncbi:MAG: carboxypeptidase-like regulatory domain-containing protein [Bdellovibrionales bacterium]|nr:carboxypeptidase-like regulatory domain-containing protein [Bdellovibrionales bacterium]